MTSRTLENMTYTPQGGWQHVAETGHPVEYTWPNIQATAQAYFDLRYQPLDADLTAIAGLTGTTGFLQKTGENSWSLTWSLNVDQINYDTALANPAWAAGQTYWDMDEGTLTVDTDISGVNCHLGREQIVRVVNKTGADIAAHVLVYINGAQGNRPTITLAKADAEATSSKTLGITDSAIVNNAEGYVMTSGLHRGADTTGFTAGDALWLSAATAGAITNSRPVAPLHAVFVGYALNSTANGSIQVGIINGFEIGELHDVSPTAPNNGEVLSWVAATGLYTPTDLTTVYQPLDADLTAIAALDLTANQLLGADAAGTGWEAKTLIAGAGVSVTHGTGTITIAVTGSTSVSPDLMAFFAAQG